MSNIKKLSCMILFDVHWPSLTSILPNLLDFSSAFSVLHLHLYLHFLYEIDC